MISNDPSGHGLASSATGRIALYAAVSAAVALVASSANCQFVLPVGHGGTPRPSVVDAPEPGTPALTRLPDATVSALFALEPGYPRASAASVKVVGAFEVAETTGVRFVAVSAPGFLPVTLVFSDGRCFALSADYFGGTLSNGRMTPAMCDDRKQIEEPAPPLIPPPSRPLKRAGGAWGFVVWADDLNGTTIVSRTLGKIFYPLFRARMPISAICVMVGPDFPGGNITLIGRINGRLTAVTLEITY